MLSLGRLWECALSRFVGGGKKWVRFSSIAFEVLVEHSCEDRCVTESEMWGCDLERSGLKIKHVWVRKTKNKGEKKIFVDWRRGRAQEKLHPQEDAAASGFKRCPVSVWPSFQECSFFRGIHMHSLHEWYAGRLEQRILQPERPSQTAESLLLLPVLTSSVAYLS